MRYLAFSFIIYFGLTQSVFCQSLDWEKAFIVKVIQPYEISLQALLISENPKEISSAHNYLLTLFQSDSVKVYNDIPMKISRRFNKRIKEYLLDIRSEANLKKNNEITIDKKTLMVGKNLDTIFVYFRKQFKIDNEVTNFFLLMTILSIYKTKDPEYKICSIKLSGLPKDKDQDKVPDDFDKCPESAGSIEYVGCPYTDRDKDGVLDSQDRCPEEKGLPQFNGCPNPDKDGDEIPDDQDRCPNDKGSSYNNGCPDSDYDGVPNIDDVCPTEKGTLKLKGCPEPKNEVKIIDKDADGITDPYDHCPETRGEITLYGCPDSDQDGVVDDKDECPNESGTFRCNGCPDQDNDGVPDKLDKCPFEVGFKSSSGCPISKPIITTTYQPSVSIPQENRTIKPPIYNNYYSHIDYTRIAFGLHVDYGIISYLERPKDVEIGQRYHYRLGASFDLHSSNAALGLYTEANFLHQTFQFTNSGVIDSFSINTLEFPLLLRLGLGNERMDCFAIGASYNNPVFIQKSDNIFRTYNNSIEQIVSDYWSVNAMAKISGRVGGLTLKIKYDLKDILNKNYQEPLLLTHLGNNFDLRFLQISLGFAWMINIK